MTRNIQAQQGSIDLTPSGNTTVKLCKQCLFRAPDERAICYTCGAASFEPLEFIVYTPTDSAGEFKAFVLVTLDHARNLALRVVSAIKGTAQHWQAIQHASRRTDDSYITASRLTPSRPAPQKTSMPVLLRHLK